MWPQCLLHQKSPLLVAKILGLKKVVFCWIACYAKILLWIDPLVTVTPGMCTRANIWCRNKGGPQSCAACLVLQTSGSLWKEVGVSTRIDPSTHGTRPYINRVALPICGSSPTNLCSTAPWGGERCDSRLKQWVRRVCFWASAGRDQAQSDAQMLLETTLFKSPTKSIWFPHVCSALWEMILCSCGGNKVGVQFFLSKHQAQALWKSPPEGQRELCTLLVSRTSFCLPLTIYSAKEGKVPQFNREHNLLLTSKTFLSFIFNFSPTERAANLTQVRLWRHAKLQTFLKCIGTGFR